MQGRTPTFPGLFLGVGGWVPILCPCGAWEVWLGGWDNRMLTQHNGRENSLGMTRTPSRSPSESLCLGRMTRNDHFSMGTQKTKMFSPSPSLAHRTLSCFVNECTSSVFRAVRSAAVTAQRKPILRLSQYPVYSNPSQMSTW